jgi:hypothetical protein
VVLYFRHSYPSGDIHECTKTRRQGGRRQVSDPAKCVNVAKRLYLEFKLYGVAPFLRARFPCPCLLRRMIIRKESLLNPIARTGFNFKLTKAWEICVSRVYTLSSCLGGTSRSNVCPLHVTYFLNGRQRARRSDGDESGHGDESVGRKLTN